MKPQSYQDSDTRRNTTSAIKNRSVRERGMHAANARPPPAVPYRRYPSLSDDGQPYFPRLRRAWRNTDENVTATNAANESDRSGFFPVGVFALLAIILIIALLVANA